MAAAARLPSLPVLVNLKPRVVVDPCHVYGDSSAPAPAGAVSSLGVRCRGSIRHRCTRGHVPGLLRRGIFTRLGADIARGAVRTIEMTAKPLFPRRARFPFVNVRPVGKLDVEGTGPISKAVGDSRAGRLVLVNLDFLALALALGLVLGLGLVGPMWVDVFPVRHLIFDARPRHIPIRIDLALPMVAVGSCSVTIVRIFFILVHVDVRVGIIAVPKSGTISTTLAIHQALRVGRAAPLIVIVIVVIHVLIIA